MAIKSQSAGGFDQALEAAMSRLTPTEQRIARFFRDNKEDVLLGSAAQIAALADTSDASVVRTARALGYDGLSALRAALLEEMTTAPAIAPSGRLKRTLDVAGASPAAALDIVAGIHERTLQAFRRPDMAPRFDRAVGILDDARRRHVFGIGPSGALARYAALQFNRIGLPTSTLAESGIALADGLLGLAEGDAILMLAYAPLYREVAIVLEEARQRSVPVVLVSDSLGPLVSDLVAETLPVPRGKADHLAMHSGTMVLIEAMIVALAARRREAAFDSLDRLNRLRAAIDKDWTKRGTRKPQ
jgi:DNA-binding MurR/RpiR family transcriptional regulator